MLNRTIAKFLFYGVAIILLVWTSSLTYSFLSMALSAGRETFRNEHFFQVYKKCNLAPARIATPITP